MTNVAFIQSLSGMNYYAPIKDKDINKPIMNIVSISKDYLYLMAEDEGIVEGAYKLIQINKRTFEKMKNFTIDNKRKELTDILKKVHQKNKEKLTNSVIGIRLEESRFHGNFKFINETKQDFVNYFNKTQPILE